MRTSARNIAIFHHLAALSVVVARFVLGWKVSYALPLFVILLPYHFSYSYGGVLLLRSYAIHAIQVFSYYGHNQVC